MSDSWNSVFKSGYTRRNFNELIPKIVLFCSRRYLLQTIIFGIHVKISRVYPGIKIKLLILFHQTIPKTIRSMVLLNKTLITRCFPGGETVKSMCPGEIPASTLSLRLILPGAILREGFGYCLDQKLSCFRIQPKLHIKVQVFKRFP